MYRTFVRGGKMKFRIKNQKKFNRFIFLTIVLFTMLTYAFISISSSNMAESKSNKEIVIVKYGDTLWSIAAKVNSSRDIREIIYDIQNINGIKLASIKPGDKIYIPSY